MTYERTTCVFGHDMAVLGRVGRRCGGCVAEERLGLKQQPGLPVGPLVEFVENERKDSDTLGLLFANESIERAYYRAKAEGFVSVSVADRICIARGVHPVMVYGDEWLVA